MNGRMMGLGQLDMVTLTLFVLLVTSNVVLCVPVQLEFDPVTDFEFSHYENNDATRLAPRQKRHDGGGGEGGLNNNNQNFYNPANFFNRGFGTFNYPGSYFPNAFPNNFPNQNNNNNGAMGNPAFPYGWNGAIPQHHYGFPSWTAPTFPPSSSTNHHQINQQPPPSSTINNGQPASPPLNINQNNNISPNPVVPVANNYNHNNNYGNTPNRPPPSPQQQQQQQHQIGGGRPNPIPHNSGGLSPTGQAINPGNIAPIDTTYPVINSNPGAAPQAPYPNNINSNPNNGFYKPQPSGVGGGGNPQLYHQQQKQQQPGGNSGTIPENSGGGRSPPIDVAGDNKNSQNTGAGNSGDQLSSSNPTISTGDWRDASNVVPVNAGGGKGGKEDTSSINLDGIDDEYLP